MTEQDQAKTTQEYKNLFVKKSIFRRKHEIGEDDDEYLDLIRFSLLGETYGIELTQLKEILKAKNIERIPKSPDYLMGILNLRSTLITVFDLKKRLGFASCDITKDSRIIIVEHEKRSIGFLVDKVNEIMKLEKRSIVDPPVGINNIKREFIKGVGKTRNMEIILPDLTKILVFDKH